MCTTVAGVQRKHFGIHLCSHYSESALREEQEAEDCKRSGLARRVGSEVAKWIRLNRRPLKRKRGKQEAAFEKVGALEGAAGRGSCVCCLVPEIQSLLLE